MLVATAGHGGPANLRAMSDDLEAISDDDSPPLEMISSARHFTRIEIGEKASIDRDLTCPVCLGIIRNATATECLHRFCADCIETSIRLGKKECPTCRAVVATRRALRRDDNFDNLVRQLYPEEQDEEEEMVDLSELRFQPLLPASLQGMYERAPRARSPSPDRMADSPVPAAPPPAAAPRRREPPAEAGPRWTCDSCTLLNSASAKRCKACGAANPTLPAKPKRPKKEKPSKASVIMDDDDDGDPEDVHEYRYAGGLVPAAERGAARAPRARGGAAQQDRDRENSAREEERRREQAERDLQRERAERHREREGAGASQVGAVYQHRKSVPLPAPPLNMADDAPSIEAQIVGRGQFALHVREASEQGMVVVWCAPRRPFPPCRGPVSSDVCAVTLGPVAVHHTPDPLPSPLLAAPLTTPRSPRCYPHGNPGDCNAWLSLAPKHSAHEASARLKYKLITKNKVYGEVRCVARAAASPPPPSPNPSPRRRPSPPAPPASRRPTSRSSRMATTLLRFGRRSTVCRA